MLGLDKSESESSVLISKITKCNFSMWLIKDDIRSYTMSAKSKINLRIYFIFSIFNSKLSDMKRQILVGMRKYKHACFNYARFVIGLPKILSNKEMRWRRKRMLNVEFDFDKIVRTIDSCSSKMEIYTTMEMVNLYEKKHTGLKFGKFTVFALKEKLDLQIEKLCIK